MDEKEIKSLIGQMKAAGLKDEEIMDSMFESFRDGDMDREDLKALAAAMGYELTDEFAADEEKDPIESKGAEGITKEQAEAAKEIEPGESEEEFLESAGAEKEKPEPEEEDEEDEEESEDEGWEEANKLFKA